MSLHLLPSPSRTSGAALPAVPGLRRPMVLHEVRTVSPATALVASSSNRCNDNRRPYLVTQRGQSNRLVTIVPGFSDRAGIGATNCAITPLPRKDRAVVSASDVVTESGATPSPLASKAIVTFARPFFAWHPGDKGRATTDALTTVGSDGLRGNAHGRVAAIRFSTGACHVTPLIQPNPLPGAVPLQPRRAGGTCTRIITVIYLDDYRDDFGPGIA